MRRNPAFSASYDTAALRPPAPMPVPSPAELSALQTLRGWCLDGAVPAMTQPLSVALVRGNGDTVARQVAQLCLERDGSWQLAACKTAIGRIALRLKTKAHDLMPARARREDDAWDSGHVIDTPSGLRALLRFEPRRATLVVAAGLAPATVRGVADNLAARQSRFAHPVRLLVLGADLDQAGFSSRTRCIAIAAAAVRVSTPSFS